MQPEPRVMAVNPGHRVEVLVFVYPDGRVVMRHEFQRGGCAEPDRDIGIDEVALLDHQQPGLLKWAWQALAAARADRGGFN